MSGVYIDPVHKVLASDSSEIIWSEQLSIQSYKMSGWNDGGRGEGGNRRMFDLTEALVSNDGMEVFSFVELGFNPIRMQRELWKDCDGLTSVGKRGREKDFRAIASIAF